MVRRTHSTLDDPEVKSIVQSMLAAGKTYDEIVAQVIRQTGKAITRSAISRGKLRWESAAQQVDAAKRDAEALHQILRESPDADMGGAAMGLMLSKILQRFTNVQEGFDDADLLELGHLLVKTQRTGQMQEALQIQRERLALLKDKVKVTAEKIDAIGRAKNLDEETLKKIREEVYGLTPEAA